jgi:hypothetical protein
MNWQARLILRSRTFLGRGLAGSLFYDRHTNVVLEYITTASKN